jgi:hypothetical protein
MFQSVVTFYRGGKLDSAPDVPGHNFDPTISRHEFLKQKWVPANPPRCPPTINFLLRPLAAAKTEKYIKV